MSKRVVYADCISFTACRRRETSTANFNSQLMSMEALPFDSWALPETCWALSPVMAPTTESFLPSIRSPRLHDQSEFLAYTTEPPHNSLPSRLPSFLAI